MTIQATGVCSEGRVLVPDGLRLKNLPAIQVMEMGEEGTVEAEINRFCVSRLWGEVVAIS